MDFRFGNKCLEICLLTPLINFGSMEYINFFNFDTNLSLEGDHSPRFQMILIILNITIFEICWYDVRHEDAR